MKELIIGAGFSGMAAGIKTGAPIFEATNDIGGICRTYKKDKFEFDIGGPHWLFGNNEAIDFVKTLVDVKTYERRAGVYYNVTLPYPIQTFADQEFVGVGERNKSFRSWLGQNFGRPMCNMFFFPFNEKYTAGLMDEILPFDNYKTPPVGDKGFVSQFHDPVGGLNALVGKMAEKCHITLNKRAVAVDVNDKVVTFQDGTYERYEKLISTIPLNQLLYICGQRNFDLPYSSVFVLNIGASPDINLPKEHWLYIPFCKSGFHRVGFYTNVDKSKAPKGKVGLSVEIAFGGEYTYDDLDVPFIIQEVVAELKSWRWIKKVITVDPTFVPTAYTWNRTLEERETHIKWLADRDIITIGRYGLWKFQGLCESIQQGLAL